MIPQTPDFIEELANIDASTRIRWTLILHDAGEHEIAEELWREAEPEPMKEAA
jgi:hypothetical protein